MPTDRLAEITAAHNGANPDRAYVSFVSGPDTYWLICQVERLRAGCQCDPPGSGEEFCTGHCILRARLAESEAENDQWQKKLAEVWAENERLRRHHRNLAKDAVCQVCES